MDYVSARASGRSHMTREAWCSQPMWVPQCRSAGNEDAEGFGTARWWGLAVLLVETSTTSKDARACASGDDCPEGDSETGVEMVSGSEDGAAWAKWHKRGTARLPCMRQDREGAAKPDAFPWVT